jgi:hypothetical protein
MIEPERVASDLPELDRSDDPRGGAAAWALLAAGATLICGSLSAVIWVW